MEDKCPRRSDILFLFDVDGTLTNFSENMTSEMEKFMESLSKEVTVAIVGASTFDKILDQLRSTADDVVRNYDYVFSENGVIAYNKVGLIGQADIRTCLGEDLLQQVINFCLVYIANLKLPAKRGTFILFRKGSINVCPVGRNCSQKEREEFSEYDRKFNIRRDFVAALREKFKDHGLAFSIGGQISFEIIPEGWDKRYCLQYLDKANFSQIHFFGDKTMPGGNDHEIFEDSRTIGHTVTSPENTREVVNEILKFL